MNVRRALLSLVLGHSVLSWSLARIAGNALSYVDDVVRVAPSPALAYPGSGGWTIEGWIYPHGVGGGLTVTPIAGQISSIAGHDPYALELESTGNIRLRVENSAGTVQTVGAPAPPDQWTHIAGVYDRANSKMLLYRNGALTASLNTSIVMESNSSYQIAFGGVIEATRRFMGELDELRIWNTARSAPDILANYDKLVSPGSPGLVGYWRFDEGVGVTTADQTSFGNTGILGVDGMGSDVPTWVTSTAPITPEPCSLLLWGCLACLVARRR